MAYSVLIIYQLTMELLIRCSGIVVIGSAVRVAMNTIPFVHIRGESLIGWPWPIAFVKTCFTFHLLLGYIQNETRKIDGLEATRDGSSENPAYYIKVESMKFRLVIGKQHLR